MGNQSVTAANVAAGSDAETKDGTAGATLTAGQMVYEDSSGLVQLADANGAAALRVAYYATLNGASANQPVKLQRLKAGTSYTPGFTMTIGLVYCLSSTAGSVYLASDVTTGDYLQPLFIPTSTTVAKIIGSGINAGVAT